LTYPLLGDNGTGTWARDLGNGVLEHTVLTVLGVHSAWLAATPVLAAVAGAVAFAAKATPRMRLSDVRLAGGAIVGWAALSTVGPTIAGDPNTPLSHGTAALALIGVSVAAAAATLLVLHVRERREQPTDPLLVPSPTR
jgi:peptidoglycan/LPS O-acetylase OafA/YrhL